MGTYEQGSGIIRDPRECPLDLDVIEMKGGGKAGIVKRKTAPNTRNSRIKVDGEVIRGNQLDGSRFDPNQDELQRGVRVLVDSGI
jgi:hypothetical protein